MPWDDEPLSNYISLITFDFLMVELFTFGQNDPNLSQLDFRQVIVNAI